MAAELLPPAVEARGLVKVFGVTPALVGIDLLVARGTVCGLTGGKGAGKTTVLRASRPHCARRSATSPSSASTPPGDRRTCGR